MANPDSPSVPDPPRPSGKSSRGDRHRPRVPGLRRAGRVVGLEPFAGRRPPSGLPSRPSRPGLRPLRRRRRLFPLPSRRVGRAFAVGAFPDVGPRSRGSAIARGLDGKRVEDPELPGVIWELAFAGDKLFASRSEGGRVERLPVEYAFRLGSPCHDLRLAARPRPGAPDRP